MVDVQSFLDKLIAKSSERRVAWKPTADSDVFTASLEAEFTVSIAKTAKQEFTFEMRDKRGHKLLHVVGEKERSWEQGYEEAVENFDKLRQLYEAARVIALDVDQQLTRAQALLDRC